MWLALFFNVFLEKEENMKDEEPIKNPSARGQSKKKRDQKTKSTTASEKAKSPNMGYHGKDDEKNLNPEE
jgi:hypothetical protein